jgi:threonine synthase
MKPVVLVPQGKIAMGKLAQAIAHGATLLQVKGNFDDCLTLARQLSENYPVALVNSVNPYRIEGQKTAAFEVVDMLGAAPDIHVMPVGNAGNITAYWKGYQEYRKAGASRNLPMMWGFQAAGAAPIVKNKIIKNPETIATAIRIGNPASWDQAVAAQVGSKGLIDSVTDKEILSAYRLVAAKEGVFVEPSSAAGIAGLIKKKAQKKLPTGKTIVVTVTGNGLKDVQWVLNSAGKPIIIPVDMKRAAKVIGLK